MLSNALSLSLTICLICILSLVVFLLLYFILKTLKDKKTTTVDKNNTRIYTYNYEKNIAHSFDKKNLLNRKTFDKNSFYEEFFIDDRPKVEEFIEKCIKNDEENKFLQVRVCFNKKKMSSKQANKNFAILEVTSINREQKMIHLQSQLLPNISDFRKKFKKDRSSIRTIEEQFKDIDKKTSKKQVIVYNLMLVPNTTTVIQKNQDEIENIRIQILNELAILIDAKTYVGSYLDNSITIIKESDYNFNKSEKFAIALQANALKYLKLSSYRDYYYIAIGIEYKDRKFTNLSLAELVKNAYLVAYSINISKESVKNIAIYNLSMQKNIRSTNLICENIIKNNLFSVYYQPVFDMENGTIRYYHVSIDIQQRVGSISIDQVITYAIENNKLQELLDDLLQRILSKVPENYPCKIIIKNQINFINFILTNSINIDLPHYIDIVFILKEDAIEAIDNEELLNLIKALNNRGIGIALLIDNEVINLNKEVMDELTYYIVDQDFVSGIYKDTRKQTSFKLLTDSLQRYNKEIIIFDCQEIPSFQYLVHSGFKYYLTDLLMKKQDNFMVVSKEDKLKLIKFYSERERKD